MKVLITIALSCAATFFPAQPVYSATAAGAGIELNGKQIGGYAMTWNRETREHLVKQLSTRPLTFEKDYTIPVSKTDSNRATLKGRIACSHMYGATSK